MQAHAARIRRRPSKRTGSEPLAEVAAGGIARRAPFDLA